MPQNRVIDMPYKTSYSLQAQLVDHDGSLVGCEQLEQMLNGLACHSDSVLNYTELAFAEECSLRGGFPRLVLDEKGRITMSVEVDSGRKLTRSELHELREDIEGQLTDGIGAGCFDELTMSTGLGVQLLYPLKPKCTQTLGTAWRPRPTTEKGNKQRIAAAAKWVEKQDSHSTKPAPSKKTKPSIKSAPSKKTTPLNKPASSKEADVREGAKIATSNNQQKPNLQKLFRLLAKPERDQLFDQIQAELESCGNDLSSIGDGEFPYGNFNDPKLLRLLLKAGLPLEVTDTKGNSLLIQAAVNPQCLELVLKNGADVNRKCESYNATTALFRAASLGKRKSVEVLLQHGADPTIKDKSGRSAADVVDKRSRERQAIIDLLR
jgi:hypothetical protein